MQSVMRPDIPLLTVPESYDLQCIGLCLLSVSAPCRDMLC